MKGSKRERTSKNSQSLAMPLVELESLKGFTSDGGSESLPFQVSDLVKEAMGQQPAKGLDFDAIVQSLNKDGSVEGFRKLRDYLLNNYNRVKHDMRPADVLSLVIAADKHAIVAEMAASKTKKRDMRQWEWVQNYLQGNTDELPSTGELTYEDEGDSGQPGGVQPGADEEGLA